MRTLSHSLATLLVLAVGAGTAFAEHNIGPCAVTIRRAPDNVRATVEAWVDREPSCSVSLEVRIVPTEGGLYVLARDERGRTFERVVPDAQSAGVLVASWMADDSMPSAPGFRPAAPPPAVDAPEATEPAPTASPASVALTVPRSEPTSRWVAVDGMLGTSIDGGPVNGVRADVDLLTLGHWSLGASVAIANGWDGMVAIGPTSSEGSSERTSDIKGLIYAVRPIDLGRWHVRPALGLGAMASTVHVVENNYPSVVMDQTQHARDWLGELAFLVARDLGASWAVQGGLVIDLNPHSIQLATSDTDSHAIAHRGLDLILLAGLAHRL